MALVSLAFYRPCGCRSHQKVIYFNSDWHDPEEDALYSKAPDEDMSYGGTLLSMELRKNIKCVPTKRSLENALARDDYCDIIRVPECWTKQNSPRRS